jgi:hypothetical protein
MRSAPVTAERRGDACVPRPHGRLEIAFGGLSAGLVWQVAASWCRCKAALPLFIEPRRANVGNAYLDLSDMRKMILALAILYPVAALAQGTSTPAAPAAPPTVGDKPLVQVKPKGAAGKKAEKQPAKPQSIAQKLQACQDLDDGTKDRLNCYDAIFKPEPKPKPAAAKGVNDCRFLKEEDERLACYNGFADKIPKLPK